VTVARSNVVLDREHLADVVDWFGNQKELVFDVETLGEHRGEPTRNEVAWIGLSSRGRAVSIPMGHPNGDRLLKPAVKRKNKATGKFDMFPPVYDDPPEQLRPSEVFDALEPLLFSDSLVKIAHNAVFDLVSVAKYYDGQIPLGPYSDTIVLQWLLNENLRTLGLKYLTEKYYGTDYDTENVGKKIELHPFGKVAHYQFMDARYTWLLYKRYNPQFAKHRLERVRRLEEALIPVLCRMKMAGTHVDMDELTHLDTVLGKEIVEAEGNVYRAAGQKFNLGSAPQKANVLFGPRADGGQGLRPTVLTPGGMKKRKARVTLTPADYTTQAEHLETFVGNPVVDSLLRYQELDKLHSTYVQGYLGDPDNPKRPCRIHDGKIHADLVQYGTVTGRFSCREPNLQNVPRPDTPYGKQVRNLFVAPPRHKLVVADYGQVELVILAHYCESGALFEGFFNGIDPHSATAAALIGQDPKAFMARVLAGDPKALALRQVGKGINFAVVFGAAATKVASMAGITVAEAERFLKLHRKAFPEIYRLKQQIVDSCRRNRPAHVTTLLGRKRRLPTIFAHNDRERAKAERQAVNSKIQGSAADLIKVAMIRLDDRLEPGMDLILSVHDELVTVAREEDADRCVELVRDAMLGQQIQALVKVPLSADVKVVDRWGDAK
jgi:DNA polymerase I-like protein with 3'-5' exonuclease and polymerase domains